MLPGCQQPHVLVCLQDEFDDLNGEEWEVRANASFAAKSEQTSDMDAIVLNAFYLLRHLTNINGRQLLRCR
jgi:hypothetical protein